jgi:tetratricopeptide (TPR) repeat protein
MPAHVYARTGDYAGAARSNLAGAEADRAYLATAPADGLYGLMYYSHNLHFLADSHMMQGRLGDARQAAAELADRLMPHADMMPMIESMIVAPTSVLLRFGQDDEVLQLPEPPGDRPVMLAWWRFARGVSYARKGQVPEATTERAAFEEAVGRVPASALFGGTGLESASTILALARLVLDARIATAQGARAQALGLWMKAVAAADRVPYDEPPIWYYPVRESLGAAYLEAGRPADAERVFRDDLARHPRNPRSLFGLRESLMRQGRQIDADWVGAAFEESWKNADTTLDLSGL